MNTVVILLAFAAAASASPVNIKAIDWPGILTKVHDIHDVHVSSIQYFKDEATAGDAEIGDHVGEYLDLRFPEVYVISHELTQEIEDQTLTIPKTKVYIERLAAFWSDVLGDLEGSLFQLPIGNEANLRARVAWAYTIVGGILQDIYVHLAQ